MDCCERSRHKQEELGQDIEQKAEKKKCLLFPSFKSELVPALV